VSINFSLGLEVCSIARLPRPVRVLDAPGAVAPEFGSVADSIRECKSRRHRLAHMAHRDVSEDMMESAGSSPASSNAHDDSLVHDYDMESANATPSSLFTTGAADSDMPHDSTSASPRHAVVLSTRSSAPITQRALPPRDVTEENIVDAYAAFILYCNPYFPLDIDTSDLRRIFQTPPRSDGKDFDIFTLWGLVQRFDSKEIKTWTQLALELGVEPPTAERGGSVQKVQQYSVRLKVRCIVFLAFKCSLQLTLNLALDARNACRCLLRVSSQQEAFLLPGPASAARSSSFQRSRWCSS
jgi:hypothetical protein